MEYLSRTNATIVFTNTMAKLSVKTDVLNQAWAQMSEFQRLPDPTGKPNTVTLHFFDESEQVAGELLDMVVAHQETDPPVFRIEVHGIYNLEFVNAKVVSIKSPGFGPGEPKQLTLEVVVEYHRVIRTTITN